MVKKNPLNLSHLQRLPRLLVDLPLGVLLVALVTDQHHWDAAEVTLHLKKILKSPLKYFVERELGMTRMTSLIRVNSDLQQSMDVPSIIIHSPTLSNTIT